MIEVQEVKKAVVVAYDVNVIKGKHASVLAAKPDGDVLEEKKNILNDGNVVLTFPHGYEGECLVSVRGSSSGEESGVIEV